MGGYGITDNGKALPFGRVKSSSLADEVATQLYNAVTTGLLRPGEKVVEAALSRQMDVSRAPIREAIRMLVERGLLIQVPRRGVFVREFGIREIEEINDLRLVIETGALQRAMSGGYLLQLEALQDAITGKSIDPGRVASVLEKELASHRAIVELYPNERFRRAYDDVADELRVAIAGVPLSEVGDSQLRREFEPLIRAIRMRDQEQALTLLTEHISDFATRVLEALSPPEAELPEPASTDRNSLAG